MSQRRSVVLAVILIGYLLVVIDVSILFAALPTIHRDLGFSSTSLSWAQNAYTLAFGGLLLLGARAGDLAGRRRMSWSASACSRRRHWRSGSRSRRHGWSRRGPCRASARRSSRPRRWRCSRRAFRKGRSGPERWLPTGRWRGSARPSG